MLIYLYMYSIIAMFFSSVYIFVSKYKHVLLMLLALESMVLSLYFLMLLYFSWVSYDSFMLMLFLSMSVCESALGLSLLVLIIRTFGDDSILMFDNLW